jgi:RNA polymerase sigma-70 factor, ECF subfamily
MMIAKRRVIVRLQRWLTTYRQRPQQADRGPATAPLPTLVAEAAAGDPRALRALAAIVVPVVKNYCRIHLGTTEAAEQVAQGISRTIIKTLPSYLRSRAPFWAYVYGVTARAVADAHRNTTPEHSYPGHRYERPPGQQLLDPGRAPALAQLLATLPSEQREVLVLRVPLRLSVEDTAKLVGTSPATVRLIQHRALDRLRQELQAISHDPRCPPRRRW